MDNDYLTQLDQDKIHVTTRPYLDKVGQHTEPYEVDVFGKSITVFPGVMSPKYDWAGLYMIECLPEDLTNKNVLELGPGSGLVSVFAGLRGAASITAADINPTAVENTLLNLKKAGLSGEVVLSDVFQNVPSRKYDLIVFNLPYHNGDPKNDLEKGVIDQEYRAMESFFAHAHEFLAEGGLLLVGFSRSGNTARFQDEVKENNFVIEKMEEKNEWDDPNYSGPDFHYNCQVYWIRSA